MEAVHSHISFWQREEFPYIRAVEVSPEEMNGIVQKLTRLDIIEWLMWNDRNGIYSDEASLREFGAVMTREEGLEIMVRQIEENRVIRNLKVV